MPYTFAPHNVAAEPFFGRVDSADPGSGSRRGAAASLHPADVRRLSKLVAIALAFGVPALLLHLQRHQLKVTRRDGFARREMWDSAETLYVGVVPPDQASVAERPPGSTPATRRGLVDPPAAVGMRAARSTPPPAAPGTASPVAAPHAVPEAAANGSAPKVGRVAVCIVGHARSFHQPTVHESIARNLIDPIRRGASAVDVFFHVAMADVPRANTRAAVPAEQETNGAIEGMHPVVVSRYSGAGRAMNFSGVAACPAGRSYACDFYHPALLRASECMEKIELYEREHGVRYEWIVKTRPDVAFGDPVALMSALPTDRVLMNEHIPGASTPAFPTIREMYPTAAADLLHKPFADHVAIVPRHMAGVFFSSHLASFECMTPVQRGRLVNAEALMGLWLIRHSVRYDTAPWFWMLVRDRGGPECKRMEWIGRATNQTGAFTQRCKAYDATGVIPPAPRR
jgi:hypothetical protein